MATRSERRQRYQQSIYKLNVELKQIRSGKPLDQRTTEIIQGHVKKITHAFRGKDIEGPTAHGLKCLRDPLIAPHVDFSLIPGCKTLVDSEDEEQEVNASLMPLPDTQPSSGTGIDAKCASCAEAGDICHRDNGYHLPCARCRMKQFVCAAAVPANGHRGPMPVQTNAAAGGSSNTNPILPRIVVQNAPAVSTEKADTTAPMPQPRQEQETPPSPVTPKTATKRTHDTIVADADSDRTRAQKRARVAGPQQQQRPLPLAREEVSPGPVAPPVALNAVPARAPRLAPPPTPAPPPVPALAPELAFWDHILSDAVLEAEAKFELSKRQFRIAEKQRQLAKDETKLAEETLKRRQDALELWKEMRT